MAVSSRANLILIVTGSTLRAEEADRPLAYYLQQQIEQKLATIKVPGEDGVRSGCAARVLADLRWLGDEVLQSLPTISLGGPRVNMLTQSWLEELPVALAYTDQYCIQMDPDLDQLRAGIWGRDNATTQIAVAVFLHRFASPFLERAASLASTESMTEFDSTDSGEIE